MVSEVYLTIIFEIVAKQSKEGSLKARVMIRGWSAARCRGLHHLPSPSRAQSMHSDRSPKLQLVSLLLSLAERTECELQARMGVSTYDGTGMRWRSLRLLDQISPHTYHLCSIQSCRSGRCRETESPLLQRMWHQSRGYSLCLLSPAMALGPCFVW